MMKLAITILSEIFSDHSACLCDVQIHVFYLWFLWQAGTVLSDHSACLCVCAVYRYMYFIYDFFYRLTPSFLTILLVCACLCDVKIHVFLFMISFTGWHRRLNYRAGAAPPFYILIKVIHSKAREVNDQIRLVSELKLRRLQRKSYRSMQAKIFLAWER